MKTCPKCHKEYENNIKFCQVDGTELEEKEEPIICPDCGTKNDFDAKFCKECGCSLEPEVMVCSECGKEYTDGAKFCKECGGKVVSEDEMDDEDDELPHNMVYVEGGSLLLGDEDEEGNPEHEVTLDSFYISKYQVTQELWESVMDDNPSKFIGRNRPVECVSWYDAVEFCNKLSKREGLKPCYKIDKNTEDPNNENEYDDIKWTVKCNFMANGYRLPTEAEWEYAARGGQNSEWYDYAGSDDIDEVAWYSDNSDDETHDVGELEPNELGLYDMSGNVWEWCWDWDGEIGSKNRTNPTGAASGSYRYWRGGSWDFNAYYCTVSSRSHDDPFLRNNGCGFRVCRSSSK